MSDAGGIAMVAALLGDPARANIMATLMDGRARTAKELAYAAHVSAPTASGHLTKLADAALIAMTRQGRHHYYRIASPAVGRMVEGIMSVAGGLPTCPAVIWRGGEGLRTARTCYDHLAGRLGVAIADQLTLREQVRLSEDGGELTEAGQAALAAIGVFASPERGRVFCRPCLDWSERRPHLAGTVGRSLALRCFELGWISRLRDTRAVAITPAGRAGFADALGVRLDT